MWCPSRATGLDNGIIFNLLVWCTVAQSPLVHRMLQGVEHTDPTGWSNSHLFIGDKQYWLFNEQLVFFIHCSLLFCQTIILVIHVVTAPQHSYYLMVQNPSKYGSQLCIHITCCSANSLLISQLYFKVINMSQ